MSKFSLFLKLLVDPPRRGGEQTDAVPSVPESTDSFYQNREQISFLCESHTPPANSWPVRIVKQRKEEKYECKRCEADGLHRRIQFNTVILYFSYTHVSLLFMLQGVCSATDAEVPLQLHLLFQEQNPFSSYSRTSAFAY